MELWILKAKGPDGMAVDRFGMAEAFAEVGARLTLGDLIYTLNIPIPLHTLTMLKLVGRTLAPSQSGYLLISYIPPGINRKS